MNTASYSSQPGFRKEGRKEGCKEGVSGNHDSNLSNDVFCTPDELAGLLKVKPGSVERLHQSLPLPSVSIDGQIRFPIRVVLDTITQRIEGGSLTVDSLFENRKDLHVTIPNDYDVLDEEEAAAFLRTTVESLRYYTKRTGELAHLPVGRSIRFFRKDLVDFLKRRRVASLDETSSASRRKSA